MSTCEQQFSFPLRQGGREGAGGSVSTLPGGEGLCEHELLLLLIVTRPALNSALHLEFVVETPSPTPTKQPRYKKKAYRNDLQQQVIATARIWRKPSLALITKPVRSALKPWLTQSSCPVVIGFAGNASCWSPLSRGKRFVNLFVFSLFHFII